MWTKEKELIITEYETKGELPNPFIFNDGNKVSSKEDWEKRRKEIYQLAVDFQFGTLPPSPEIFRVEQLNCGKEHRTYKIHVGTKLRTLSFIIKIIMPKGNNRPIIINGDMCAGYFMNEQFIKAATDKDVGWLLFDRTELAHDILGEKRCCGDLYEIYPNFTFGSIGAWAWGFSRCIDALEILKLEQIDLSCLIVTGHSRGGKAAILAGAIDERISIVNPNEACLFGGGCFRVRMTGEYPGLRPWRSETLRDIWEQNEQWLGQKMEKYIDKEELLPFDTHFLKVLIAPRILFVSEAAGDVWANPVGSWLTTMAAKEVYDFLGVKNNLYWYFREGTHYHKPKDIEMLVSIICHVHDDSELTNGFFEVPFKKTKLLFSWKAPNKKEKCIYEKNY